MMILGPILVLVVIFFPQGMAGQLKRVWARFGHRSGGA
jgi:ABC-type branched-subunit amino acid transport system permease subunit